MARLRNLDAVFSSLTPLNWLRQGLKIEGGFMYRRELEEEQVPGGGAPTPPELQPPLEPVSTYFPEEVPEQAANTFEIALVLGGTVSAGGYTAGVLDFLFEALDAWEAAKKNGGTAANGSMLKPSEVANHNIKIRVIAGTSGGALNGLIAARALRYQYQAAPGTAKTYNPADHGAAPYSENPFYNTWVNELDIKSFLATTDLANGAPVASLLNAEPLEQAARNVLGYSGPRVGRGYVSDWLQVLLTYSNVPGVPYRQSFGGNTQAREYFTRHADFVRYAVNYSDPQNPLRSWAVDATVLPSNVSWGEYLNNFLGTAAFPIGLPARVVARPATDYRYRFVMVPGANGMTQAAWLAPEWQLLLGGTPPASYAFPSADGGCTNNQPIELARQLLVGTSGVLKHTSTEANRAIILVDPFTETPDMGSIPKPGQAIPLLSLLPRLVSMLVQSNRFSSSDSALFLNNSVYSHFLIAPRKGILTGSEALASTSLAAFLGFMSKAFRHHDYMLGRRNCQQFLRDVFVLAKTNPIFSGNTSQIGQTPTGELPIIPLFASTDKVQPDPAWPVDVFDPESIRGEIKLRVSTLLSSLSGQLTNSWLVKVGVALLRPWVAGMLTDACENAISEALRKKKLLTKAPPPP